MNEFFRGMLAIVPLALGGVSYGLALGVLSQSQGFSPMDMFLMGGLVFAGSSQIAAVTNFDGQSALWAAVIAAAVLNLRYVGILASMPPVFGKIDWPRKLLGIHLTADENWALTLSQRQQGAAAGYGFHMGAALTLLCGWLASTVAGNLLGQTFPSWTEAAVGFTFTAAFIAMTVAMVNLRGADPLVRNIRKAVPVIVSFCSMLVLVRIEPIADFAILLASALGVLTAFVPLFAVSGANDGQGSDSDA